MKHPSEQYAPVKLDQFSTLRVKNKKNLKPFESLTFFDPFKSKV